MLGHSTSSEMFTLQFHTGFIDDKGLRATSEDIEVARRKPAKFGRDFAVRVECKIINKQLKKEMPWQPAGAIVQASAGQVCRNVPVVVRLLL